MIVVAQYAIFRTIGPPTQNTGAAAAEVACEGGLDIGIAGIRVGAEERGSRRDLLMVNFMDVVREQEKANAAPRRSAYEIVSWSWGACQRVGNCQPASAISVFGRPVCRFAGRGSST